MQGLAADEKRTLADALNGLEAAKPRVTRDARAAAEELKKQLVEKLLPVLDNLDRTIAAADAANNARALVEGVLHVRQQLESVLRCYGVERIDAQDRTFDPAIHEAITTMVVPLALHDMVMDQISPGLSVQRRTAPAGPGRRGSRAAAALISRHSQPTRCTRRCQQDFRSSR